MQYVRVCFAANGQLMGGFHSLVLVFAKQHVLSAQPQGRFRPEFSRVCLFCGSVYIVHKKSRGRK